MLRTRLAVILGAIALAGLGLAASAQTRAAPNDYSKPANWLC